MFSFISYFNCSYYKLLLWKKRAINAYVKCLQLQETLQELEKLLALAQNQRVKDILSREVRKVQTEVAEQAKKAAKKESETQAKPAADQTVTYTKEIKNYGMNLGILCIYDFVGACACIGSVIAFFICSLGSDNWNDENIHNRFERCAKVAL